MWPHIKTFGPHCTCTSLCYRVILTVFEQMYCIYSEVKQCRAIFFTLIKLFHGVVFLSFLFHRCPTFFYSLRIPLHHCYSFPPHFISFFCFSSHFLTHFKSTSKTFQRNDTSNPREKHNPPGILIHPHSLRYVNAFYRSG